MTFPEPTLPLLLALTATVAALLLLVVSNRRRSLGPPSLRWWLAALAWSLVAVAVARPRWGVGADTRSPGVGVLWLCVDVSRSMLVRDVPRDRLDRAKRMMYSTIGAFGEREVGLIAFAGSAQAVAPPSRDREFLREAIEGLSIDSVESGGTNLASAVSLVVATRKHAQRGSDVVLVFSDGGHGAALIEAVDLTGLVFATIGIGDPEVASRIPASGQGGALRERGEWVTSRLDEAPLRELASRSGGIYVPARTEAVDLSDIVTTRLTPRVRDIDQRRFGSAPAERYRWFLLPAFLLALSSSTGWPRTAGSDETVQPHRVFPTLRSDLEEMS